MRPVCRIRPGPAGASGTELAVAERFGDWDRTPWTPAAPEVITLARPA